MSTEILSLKSVSFSYPNTPIFEDLSISFRRGELVALLGANGAGKTTLLRLLNGLLRPKKGIILLNGKPLPKKVSEVAQSVGIAFQNPTHQFFASTVQEELEYGKRWRKSNRSTANESIQQVAAQFNLEALFGRSPHTLSSGEQRRLSIATIVALGAQLIALDEPTVGQDSKGREMLASLLGELKRSGRGIVVATHDVEWVASLTDHVLLLKRNNKPIQGPPSKILTSSVILRNADLHIPQLVELGNVLDLEALHGEWNSLTERTANELSNWMRSNT
ncbi:MAG: energy-coupling factor ABC transporter ATP-binding protein [Candidatus Thorarchaeota archaeon]